MKNRIAIIIAALVALTIIGVASPAQAASCSTGHICFYDTTSGTGFLGDILASAMTRNACYPMSTNENNRIGYINNASSALFYVWDSSNCTGAMRSPVYANTAGSMNSDWNNRISSIMRL